MRAIAVHPSNRNAEIDSVKITHGFVLGNKVVVTVNASPNDFTGVEDQIKAQATYPGLLEHRLLLTPIGGLEKQAEMIRALTDDRDAIKVYVKVASAS